MPTVSAPSSRAIRATTGAAPEPVPPPSPAVTNTMSLPRSAFLIWSYASSAARRPMSGSAPEPRPCVSSRPMWIFVCASDICSCWMSVLTAMNSTCETPASIIRWSAFRPAPPTPTTRITARYDARVAARRAVEARRRLGQRVARGAEAAPARAARLGAGFGRRLRHGRGTARARAAGADDVLDRLLPGRDVLDGLLVRLRRRRAFGCRPALLRPAAAPPRSRGRAPRAGLHASTRAFAPLWSTSFARSRYISAASLRRVVLEHRLALHGRLGVADGLANLRVEDEVAEVLLEDLDRLARVQQPLVEHRRQDPDDLDLRVQVLADHRQRVLELHETAQREVLALHGHDHAVGRDERVDRQQAERRRRVDEDEVVVVADRRERLLERALAADHRRERELGAGEVDRRDGERRPRAARSPPRSGSCARARRTSSARSRPGSAPGSSSGCPAGRGR